MGKKLDKLVARIGALEKALAALVTGKKPKARKGKKKPAKAKAKAAAKPAKPAKRPAKKAKAVPVGPVIGTF
jgi:hypothetical protein